MPSLQQGAMGGTTWGQAGRLMEKEGAFMGMLGRLGSGHSYLFSETCQEPLKRYTVLFPRNRRVGWEHFWVGLADPQGCTGQSWPWISPSWLSR